ncbi:MAG: type II secretion system protein [Candidatus Vogelbacteria bacterium]|nr:type II secretion system protein [Candidatus Vogelbacteria bacterium]
MKRKAKNEKRKVKSGFTLLEILIGASIITASFLGVLTVFDRLAKSSRAMVELSQAGFLLEESLEAVRTWRDSGWANLADWPVGTDYYLIWNGSRFATSTAKVFLDGKFERKIGLTAVSRDDTTKDIVPSGGTVDPNTKLATVSVAWRSAGSDATTTQTVSAYFTNLFN